MDIERQRTEIINRMLNASDKSTDKQPKKTSALPESIAIIGLSGYLPKSMNVQEFWDALDNDKSLIDEIPSARIDWKNNYDPLGKDPDKSRTKWGGIIPDIESFDSDFFGILPGEADLMDPRKRLLLMSVYQAMEDAGYAPGSFKKSSTGVFVAIEEDEYSQCIREAGIDSPSADGNSSSLIANQISYFFDLRGPSEVVNTMCSGAAVAIHHAVNSLRAGEISCAIVGAANLLLHPDPFVFLSRTQQLSNTNTVNSFGKNANGYLRADGIASIILKPLSKAVEDNDSVYAVIKNTAVNYNGQGGMSMAAPNVLSHAELIKNCYSQAGIDPGKVNYIEAQGMGNPVADMVEWQACNRALKALGSEKAIEIGNGSCRVSTLKPMIGHMHAASAMGALFKIIRSFQTNKVHKIIGLTEINPDIETENQPCRLVAETEHWPQEKFPRLAGLHAYGSGGNNAHILVEEFKQPLGEPTPATANTHKVIIPCSANTENECKVVVQNLLASLKQYPNRSLSSIAYTMQTGRDALKHRIAFFASTQDELIHQANGYIEKNAMPDALPSKALAWIKGDNVEWNTGHIPDPIRRLHLPVYPFKGRPHWFNQEVVLSQPSGALSKSESIVREVLSTFLKSAAVDLNREFSELGFDSLLVIKMSTHIRQKYGLNIEPAVFFENTSPGQLIQYIGNKFSEQLDADRPGKNEKKYTTPLKKANKYYREAETCDTTFPVAIIGVSGIFPQSSTLDDLWQNLMQGKNCIEEVPVNRWRAEDHFHPDKETANRLGKSYAKWGGFVKDYYHFDPLFFNISPLEVELMSPKERLFLQCAWHALEDAGYTPQTLSGEQVGVFAGVTRGGIDPYKTSMFSISNRISYVMNLQGPSMTIDTACSSSLVAIHEACRHLYTGECSVALAGGVHVFLDPSHFSVLSGMHMLSPDGSSKAFGDKANGMIPGEGAGILMLKSLKQAIADKDIIYGVIKGSATNHGGKTNGFTVPNPRAQQNLVTNALQRAGVNARAVSYVEAHGTGTPLGDPIEIRGLTEAFKKDTADTQYCRIGSIKTNIGHLEAAAGISGLIKILLQMKHKKLVPSLHSQQLNPQINFPETPFIVQQELEDWNPKDRDGNDITRIACVSSFGAGGANAHVVIEEYQQASVEQQTSYPVTTDNRHSYIILLSAKDHDRLNELAKQLLTFIRNENNRQQLHIADLAYTLQVGRVAFVERLAMEVFSMEELESKLEEFLQQKKSIEKLYHGRIKDNREIIDLFGGNTELEQLADGWAGSQNYHRLLSLWVKGLAFDWQKLYDAISPQLRPRRISLPGYPFAREFYGLPPVAWATRNNISSNSTAIHPLVHKNTSTFFKQGYSSEFTGEEFFLKDHVVNGQKLLPGVAYLEMVNIAFQQAVIDDGAADEKKGFYVQLKNVAWVQPVIVQDEPITTNILLDADEDGSVRFHICSEHRPEAMEDRTHCQGSVSLVPDMATPVASINDLTREAGYSMYSKLACYEVFSQMGVTYGPALQGIEEIYVGKERLAAKLALPSCLLESAGQFSLHPALMDAALQSILGFMIAAEEKYPAGFPVPIPFALEQLTIFENCTSNMWAYVHMKGSNGLTGHVSDFDSLSFDIDLVDESGNICVQIKKYTARVLKKEAAHAKTDTLLVRPSWQEEDLSVSHNYHQFAQQIIILCGEHALVPEAVTQQGQHYKTITLRSAAKKIAERLNDYTVQLVEELQRIFQSKPKEKILLQLIVPASGEEATFTALYGLLKTAETENPMITAQLVNPENGRRQKLVLNEYTAGKEGAKHPWKNNGVYLITGGLGGLGTVFANDIVQQVQKAVIILAGRAPLNEIKQAQLNKLAGTGATVFYKKIDVSIGKEVTALIEDIRRDHGGINGIIHCAGVLDDSFILKKTREGIRKVLAPKVQGLVNLDQATRHMPLDMIVVCSSTSSVLGNVGQGDYAVANAFMDAYASYRNALVLNEQRFGNTVSINWPLWENGGMQVDEKTKERMYEQLGMTPLKTQAALQALYRILDSGYSQMLVMQGNLKRLRGELFKQDVEPPVIANNIPHGNNLANVNWDDQLKNKAIAYFKKIVSGVMKLPVDKIDAEVSMDEYGIDSIMVMQLTRELEKVFGSLSKTLFFEYRNINEVATFFIESYSEKLHSFLLPANTAASTSQLNSNVNTGMANKVAHAPKLVPAKKLFKSAGRYVSEIDRPGQPLDIAVIGLAGRYPQAANMHEFWEVLKNGKNCITEIPKDRWDHDLYFDKDKNKVGKTYTKWGGFLDGMDEFDALFFNISPKEAEILDPQERLFLQCAYEVIEDAGYTKESITAGSKSGKGANVGVYVGVMWEEYQLYGAQETALGRPMALSSSPSSIANRVSYYFNFNGPSMAVDTMCSSSLTSIHLACQSLQQGECEVAIAGGVNVSLHPNKYLVLGYAKIASSKGLCESFGAMGDGYVASEGVGAVLLKPLSKAIADNDQIYGVIKGTSVNHGGKANGYTVPNPNAQAGLINRAITMSGFNADTISYVEAHGTGTSLGDPIEITALNKAFNTSKKQFCAIGSVKSNIGHCESAAGVAGLTKVLLQMKYGQLVPSLHSEVLNPNIDFINSPFVVQQHLAEWPKQIIDVNGVSVLNSRRAGISSFGAGGSNAHVIVEEHTNKDLQQIIELPVAVILSAKNEERLQELAKRLLTALRNKRYEAKDLVNMAYTLQVGREAMEERLAMEVSSIKELEENLDAYIRGEVGIENMYLGRVRTHKEILSFFTSDGDMEKVIDNWLSRKKYPQILGLWVHGLNVQWEKLYSEGSVYNRPRRISLPAYPFLRTRYWPKIGTNVQETVNNSNTFATLHPLVQQNTSTFAEQRFSSVFNGNEFFLHDHIVNGQKLMPGVAFIEMISEAMYLAGGQERSNIMIENIVWPQPLVVNGQPQQVDIELFLQEDGAVAFEINNGRTNGTSPVTYSQGIVHYTTRDARPSIDITALKQQFSHNIIQAGECYNIFSKMGIEYGPAQRGIESIYLGEGEVLARMHLPPVVADTLKQYYLHPSLTDASLQSVMGLLAKHYTGQNEIPLAIPFAIQSLEVFGACTAEMWAFARYSNAQDAVKRIEDAGQLSFDIDLCDEQGNLCVSIKGFTSRIIKGQEAKPTQQGVLMMQPYWKQQDVSIGQKENIHYDQHLIILVGNSDMAGAISAQLSHAKVLTLQSAASFLGEAFEYYAIQTFKEVKQLLAAKPQSEMLVQVVVPANAEQQVFLAIAGLLSTAKLENPLFAGQVIAVGNDTVDGIIRYLQDNNRHPGDTIINYTNGIREIADLRKYIPVDNQSEHIWKEEGVYLITGGAGGLGLIFLKEIAANVKNATVILAGRSLLNQERKAQLNEIRSRGVNVEYKQVDITDKTAVQDLVRDIMMRFGKLHGVIHCPGILRDNLILKKTEEEITTVLAPKVKGFIHLDHATADIGLDFFIVCSSSAGITGNAGQADYAMANAFMDRYANYRYTQVKAGQRSGKTLSMNWPLWEEGGMNVTEGVKQLLFENIGMVPLKSRPALKALYQAMSADTAQMMVMQGDVAKLNKVFLDASGNTSVNERSKTEVDKEIHIIHHKEELKPSGNKQAAIAYFSKLLSAAIKLPADQIDAETPMDEYGIDSVMVMQMTNVLEKVFGNLSKTLFFEYRNINELAGYFQKAFPEKLKTLISTTEEKAEIKVTQTNNASSQIIKNNLFSKSRFGRGMNTVLEKNNTDVFEVAIVGLAGSYPQARTIGEFWNVLKEGRNCITEVPVNRWDYNKYFDREKQKTGKTYSKWGGFLDGFDEFDPLFFNISPKEAEIMDPQERLFLQCVYETLEDAGYARKIKVGNESYGITNNVGVFVGVMSDEYQLYGPQETALGRPLVLSGNSASIANRVSYYFDFEGPSIALNTMCSSSLTAIHLACQSLRLGECEAAIAGGVNLIVHPSKYIGLAYGKFLSSKGLCESFGAGGDGYVPGEGVGAVLLKPLSKALKDKDHIYGVIKGSAVNHGGKTNGYTVPNPAAQANVVKKVMDMAGFDPRTISFIEAHGTGTSLGDPIEITGLNKAFDTIDSQYCAIGSVKTNIGHCESAAGIAGLTKVLLQMKHRKLVPSLHSEELNPYIDFTNSPFVVQQKLSEWHRPILTENGATKEFPLRAGISSFGAGGANAHLLIEEYNSENTVAPGSKSLPVQLPVSPALVVLSAKDSIQLQQQAKNLLLWMHESGELPLHKLADLAFTLQTGREAMDERLAIEASSFVQLKEKLKRFTEGENMIDGLYTGSVNGGNNTLKSIVMDEDLPDIAYAWVEKGKYGKLLELWTKGLQFDWNKLYVINTVANYLPQRISLPVYPFARKRCWFTSSPVDTRSMALLKKHWEEAATVPHRKLLRHVGILYSSDTKALAQALQKKLPHCVLIDVHNPGAFLPGGELHHELLTLDGVIDIAGCGSVIEESPEWIQVLQHLIEYGNKNAIQLVGVTSGLETFLNERVNMSGALRAGLYRMLGSEYSHLTSRHLDVEAGINADVLAGLITEELSFVDEEIEICYRAGRRYRAIIKEIMKKDTPDRQIQFSKHEALWITGGTRGLGYLCAQHFVNHYGVKRLVLSGRESLPSRNEWPQYLQQQSDVAEKIRNIIALETMGVEVSVSAVALTDKNAIQKELEDIRNKWGNIHGIIHCAGVGDYENPAFFKKSVAGVQKVMAPKVKGLNTLYECVKTEPLKFFALFSSVSAIIPSLAAGQAAYAMANAYMDYFAEAHFSDCPLISIQWPNWKDSGMGEVKTNAYRQSGLLSLTDMEGLQLLDKVLLQKAGSVVVPAMIDNAMWQPEQLLKSAKRKQQSVDKPASDKPVVEEAITLNEGSIVDTTREWLTDLFARELKLHSDELKPDKPFSDYGVDSILLTQILQHIQKKLQQNIDPSVLFEYSTISALSAWLVNTYPGNLPQAASGAEKRQPQIAAAPPPEEKEEDKAAGIAVVGMACRFPGAEDVNAYWSLLREGRSAIRTVPGERWNGGPLYYAGLINDPYYFDPAFFLLHENDARAMDAQALLVLEESLKLFYHAGYTIEEVRGKSIGVYLGGRSNHIPDAEQLRQSRNPIITVGQNYMAANISRFFDLRGPSIVIDTACSSALVAMNMAVQALQNNEIEAAVVGGVNFLHSERTHRLFEQRGILSNNTEFHIFDQRAKGIVLGEGAGMVFLRKVDDAVSAGNTIYATFQAIAINNDGRTAGPAAPNIEAQKQVMQTALAKCGKKPEDISYIEVNGSGSEVTDLIELKAIQAVYRSANKLPCALGSIKPNIGHPMCAEGIAGFIKVVQMLHHNQLVPFLSGNEPMKHFNLSSSSFTFSRTATAWQNGHRVAAINCFADGGTNAHIIIESWQSEKHEKSITRKPLPVPALNRYNLRTGAIPASTGEAHDTISIWETFK